jgi:glutamate synthase (NADPH/NADH) large chain
VKHCDTPVGGQPGRQGLYDPSLEHDACGVGFVAHIKNKKSHDIVRQGLRILDNLTHRGATGYDPLLGDGAGILIQMPDEFLRAEAARIGLSLPVVGEYACGMVFLPQSANGRMACESVVARLIYAEGQNFLGWRDVPRDNAGLAEAARDEEPVVRQVFIGRGSNCADQDAFERKLFVIRRRIELGVARLNLSDVDHFYIPSLSSRTLAYKGMLLAHQVGEYYLDLKDERLTSALALVHQRFSTNTFPKWDLAHPFRMIAHNGEINTLRGNINWMAARQKAMSSTVLGEDLNKLWPLIEDGQSDSACFDNALELLVMGGYSMAHAMMMLIPEAWAGNPLMDEDRRAFYEFHAPIMEPWDGPAAVAFTDGRQIGATLDRNGLRPARYLVTEDDIVLMASEMGVLTFPEEKIVKKWRLQPGKMFLIDLEQGRIIDNTELKQTLATAEPYSQWIDESRVYLGELPAVESKTELKASLLDTQQAFGYTQEDVKVVLYPMAKNGEEPTGSMGNDVALPVLSDKNKPLYNYFKQLFAQVTNPPIDPIREEIVMSLTSFIGPQAQPDGPDRSGRGADPASGSDPAPVDAGRPGPSGGHRVPDPGPLQVPGAGHHLPGRRGRRRLRGRPGPPGHRRRGIRGRRLQHPDSVRPQRGCRSGRRSRPAGLFRRAPRPGTRGPAHQHRPGGGHRFRPRNPPLRPAGRLRRRSRVPLAGPGDHQGLLWGVTKTRTRKPRRSSSRGWARASTRSCPRWASPPTSPTAAPRSSKRWASTAISSGSYFTGTVSQVEGVGLKEVAEEAVRTHRAAFSNDPVLATMLDAGGEYAFRVRGEEHMWTPDAIAKLQHATRGNQYGTYKEYAALINDQSRRLMTLRGLFEIKPSGPPVPLDEVESAKEIVKRFATGAMSLGSISTEAHSTLAIAMNRIGGKSNTGEGGEDPMRFKPVTGGTLLSELIGASRIERDYELKDGDSLRSAIKQVASGRFGVTAEYLANADQIQIKMAQGAKPGEGGQLPGHKVSEYIGFLRHSVPGVGLISPPPHHDIYSIEDLAQLIHDLKNANPAADISVKLVSEVGVGTVAAGVAKAKSDHILIAGHDGGTGASPISSVKHAGTPWELGLAETQQTLVLNRLRGRVRVQTDGQLKTGRDVVVGALLGADEFGFSTAPLVVEGCIMMRKCHLNTCPVGVATQDPVLRKRFTGQPEHVVNYFFFVAEEVRELMAEMGIRKFDDLIGRSDLLDMRHGVDHWKAKGLDFSRIFHMPPVPADVARCHRETQDHGLDKALDHSLIARARPALERGERVVIDSPISNVNRTAGTMLSHEVAKRHGHAGLPDDSIHVNLTGTAGQSFGAFLARGITLELTGEGNDYVGKGLSGGRIIVKPPKAFKGVPQDNIIVGNTVLYGAIAGEVFFHGVGGERFCVRNSGAVAVVEGTGDHGCEYMTGGTVVVLGQTGRNFAAGMSGGIAYVLDADGMFDKRCNLSMVTLEKVLPAEQQPDDGTRHKHTADETLLKDLIRKHLDATGSEVARGILENWTDTRERFVKVFPNEYRRALKEIAAGQLKEAA